MDVLTAVQGLRACSCSCQHSTAPYRERSDLVKQRVGSNSLAGSRQGFDAPLKTLRWRLPVRSVYSPFVESFEASNVRPLSTRRNGIDGEFILASSSSVTILEPALETSAKQDSMDQKSLAGDDQVRNEQESDGDDNSAASQDPVAAAHGDSTLLATASDAGHDLEARRTPRYHPQTMSLTQGFRAAGTQGISCAIGAVGRPVANAGKLGGPAGLMMGLAVAGLGIATAVQKAVENQPQAKLCTRCDGYGFERCDVCDGAGKISWEGKAHRVNTCPRCFGSRLKKCPRCDGCRAKKESTPVLQNLKAPPTKK